MLVGNGKTYQHLMSIKHHAWSGSTEINNFSRRLAYTEELSVKVYYHAGLKELANSSGFRSTTLKSLESCTACSNFNKTHCFLLQAWEAIYCTHTYTTNTTPSYLVENVKYNLTAAIDDSRSPHQLIIRIEALLQDNAYLTILRNLQIKWHKEMLSGAFGWISC